MGVTSVWGCRGCTSGYLVMGEGVGSERIEGVGVLRWSERAIKSWKTFKYSIMVLNTLPVERKSSQIVLHNNLENYNDHD